ncbi:MAG: hypothetical protein WC533_00565 [Candidatus Pacearchaeota archaeon]
MDFKTLRSNCNPLEVAMHFGNEVANLLSSLDWTTAILFDSMNEQMKRDLVEKNLLDYEKRRGELEEQLKRDYSGLKYPQELVNSVVIAVERFKSVNRKYLSDDR